MKLYHVTEKSSADSIIESGFKLDFIGLKGGFQLGEGIYFTNSLVDIEYWQHRLPFANPMILECEVDDSNIVLAKDIRRMQMLEIAIEIGWCTPAGKITEKCKHDLGADVMNADEKIKSITAKKLGYSGIVFNEGRNIVIWDISVIKEIKNYGV